ncbi:MAG: hypothetical protein ACFE96_00360 [Candidatus Hermodarchaeota archaeon]
MVVGGKAKVGPILGIVGSAILLIAGFMAFGTQALIEAQLSLLGLTWADIGFDPSIFMIRGLITVLVSLLGVIGAILALVGKKVGAFLLLIAGIVAVVGSFIPMATMTIAMVPIPVTLIYPFFYVESFLMLIGGILALALKE